MALMLSLISWTAVAALVLLADPNLFGIVPVFFILIFIALLTTFSLVFTKRRRALLASLAVVFYLILRYLGIGHLLNLLLITGVAIAIDFGCYSK